MIGGPYAQYPREIPALPWYRRALPQMCMAGFLPFSAIYIELYYICAAVWGHKVGRCRLTPLDPRLAHLTPRLLSTLETKM